MANETNLRARPHQIQLYLSIYKPKTMLACQVNDGSIAVGEDDILYDSVTTGSYVNVRPGMTMYIGSSPGTADYGRLRVRYASSTGTIRVSENSEINWQNDLYLTVVDFYEIWSVFPNYALDGEDVIFYKDNDIPYTNQNLDASMGAFVQMGPHCALFVTDSVSYDSQFSLSPANRTPLTYQWFFEGGTVTGSSSKTPGTISYNTPGHYTTRLTVTTSDGIQETSYRHISVYTPVGGTAPPTQNFEVVNLKGSREEGGYTATIRIHQDITEIMEGALVILFTDPEIYGSTTPPQGLGGNSSGRGNTVLVGYILEGSIHYNYQNSYVEFDIGSSSEIMKQQPGLSISLDSVESPSTWYEMQDMDTLKAVYHYFKWHSTLLHTNDVIVTGTNYKFQYFDSEAATLYDAMQSFLQGSAFQTAIDDMQNTLYIEDMPESVDYNNLATEFTLLRQDWINEPEITERLSKEVSYLELSGVAWAGAATGTWEAYISASPGNSFAYYGSLEEQTGLILTSQNMLNTLAGRVFAYKNARFPDITVGLAGTYKTFDITPLKRYGMTILPGDTVRGINFVNKPLHISEVSWEHDPKNSTLLPEFVFHELPDSFPGTTILRPQTPIVNPPIQPPIELPPFPIIPIPTPFPIPPPIVPVPPTASLECFEDIHAPPNGPYNIFTGEIRSDEEGIFIPFDSYIRKAGIDHLTRICFNGRWEYTVNNGQTWLTWPVHTGLEVDAVDGTSLFQTLDLIWDSYAGNSPEERCALFDIGLGGSYTGHITGLNVYITPSVSEGTAPFSVTYNNVDVGVADGTWDYDWNAGTWKGTAVWFGEATGFPVFRKAMTLFSTGIVSELSADILIGCRPNNGIVGVPRIDYDNDSAIRVARFDDPGGTAGSNPTHEGITGTASGQWYCWQGIVDPHSANTGTWYLGHFFGTEGRSEGGASWDRYWEVALLSVNAIGPEIPIYRFVGTVSLYNIC